MISFCKRCTISTMRPRITFDADGICSACHFAEHKASVNWWQRERELKELCDFHRSRDGSFDVIVPVSGGKDGGFVAHQLKTVYGMHPLCVSFAPLLPTEIGQKNLRAFIESGFDVIQIHPNGQIARKLARLAFEHMGDPFQPFIYGQTHGPLRIATQENIGLVFWAEDGEAEYGGAVKVPRAKRSPEDHDKHYFSGKSPEFWEAYGISAKELEIFQGPRGSRFTPESHFFGYYRPHDPQENMYYCAENVGFSPNPERTEGTYSKYASLDDKIDGWHYFLSYLKFGIGRATSDTAHEIRDGKITREEGVMLVKKFDGEMPVKYLPEFLEYMNMSQSELNEVFEKWKNPMLWGENGLKHAVWMNDSGAE